MVVETYSDKEVAVGTCEMAPEMFSEAIKITKEAIGGGTSAHAAKTIKNCFDEKYGGNWMAIVGEGYGLFFAHKAKNFAHFFVGKTKSIVIFQANA
jgi:hypothetical protein